MFLFITFCLIIIIQIFFYLFIFGKFSFSKSKIGKNQSVPVSIVICSKNEESNLQKHLPAIADQDYPLFEMVLIDDGSIDNTLNILLDFKNKYSSVNLSIQVIGIDEKTSNGKKSALSLGIKASKYDHILLTDADCKPVSKLWIQEMTSHFSSDKTVVLGFGAYRKIEGSFLNKIIRFETLLTAIQYFSFALIGQPYMGVGRNLAYHRKEFEKAGGFGNHLHLASGDDDLFINQVANDKNTVICTKKNSFTISEPKLNFNNWIKQKRRHITTASHYSYFHKLFLALFYGSQLLFWILSILLLVFKISLVPTLSLIVLRFLIWYLVIYMSANRLNEKDIIGFAPIYEFSIIFIQLYTFIANSFSPPKQW